MLLLRMLLFGLLVLVSANKIATKSHQEHDVFPLALEVVPRNIFSDLARYDVSDKLLNVSYSQRIPKIIWISVANASDEFPPHINEFTSRNEDWTVKIVGNIEKDKFINTLFAGTRVQWAYDIINPRLGASKCDIWRYATLYLYGGFYMDYDATIRTTLNDIIQRDDSLIVAQDGTPFYDYFRPQFKLSNKATFSRYTNFTEFALQQMHGKDPKTGYPKLFRGMFLINWAIFTAPRNPVFIRTLENIAEILWAEYVHLPVVNMFGHTEKYLRLLFCTTFPFTTSLREKILEGDPEVRPRVCGVDFREYGGRCKAISTSKDPDHYRNTMKKNNDILSHYSANLKPAEIGSYFEGFTVMAHSGGKGVFVVRNGSRHTVPDLDTFNAMRLKHDEILYVSDDIFRTIPVGTPLPSLSA